MCVHSGHAHFILDFAIFWGARSQSGEKRLLASLRLSVSVGAELFHGDRWTDGETDKRDEANSRFSQFCERA